MPGQSRVPAVSPLKRTRLVDRAASVLREGILNGRLAAGTRLRQMELARRLAISRTPLREALMKLEQEGLIERLPGAGLRVKLLELDEAAELYDIREVLDGLAARLAAQRISESEIRALERQIRRMNECRASQDAHQWFVAHVAFHDDIFRASGNRRLQGLVSVVRLSIQRFHPVLLSTPNRLNDAFGEHRGIFDAIRTHDPEAAERLARAHIANAREIVLKAMSRAPGATSAP